MKLLYSFCFLLLGFLANSQKVLKGIVLDAERNKAIPNASVFLNTTSIGTVTNEQGDFSLVFQNGKYDLIVSSIGYETYNQTINTSEIPDFITIKLKIKSQVLNPVIVEPYEKDGWEKWGKLFLESFIGTSASALNCRIENVKVIHFRNSKKTNELTAIADEPLIIENKALGYTLKYQLETFTYNFSNHYLLYIGYPLFLPMEGSAAKQKKWRQKREEAYFGSIMHFMRSVYRNKISEEGFEVRNLKKIPNTEKQNKVFSNNTHSITSSDGTIVTTEVDKNTGNIYDQILHPDNYKDVIGKTLTGDSIAYAVDSTTAGLYFNNFLLVIYKNKIAPPEYGQQLPRNGTAMMSQIVLINGQPIEIEANGNYYDPTGLMSMGYWAWSEKIANMLPFDYKPPSDVPR
jgi:hypothetical protein